MNKAVVVFVAIISVLEKTIFLLDSHDLLVDNGLIL